MIIFCLPSSSSDTTVLINVAMTTPWNMMDQLQNWASLLQDHIDKLKLTAEQVVARKGRLDSRPFSQVKGLQAASWRRWQLYTEPGDELEAASSPTKRTSRTIVGEKDEELEALPEGTLARSTKDSLPDL